MFINIKGHTGKYNALVTGFYKENIVYLKQIIIRLYEKEYNEKIPEEFKNITTIKELKKFVKTELNNIDNYPFGFKHIEGVFCLYECIG